MTEHYTKATVEVSAWCRKCTKFTRHRVLLGKLAGCIPCEARPTKTQPAAAPASTQESLFDEEKKS